MRKREVWGSATDFKVERQKRGPPDVKKNSKKGQKNREQNPETVVKEGDAQEQTGEGNRKKTHISTNQRKQKGQPRRATQRKKRAGKITRNPGRGKRKHTSAEERVRIFWKEDPQKNGVSYTREKKRGKTRAPRKVSERGKKRDTALRGRENRTKLKERRGKKNNQRKTSKKQKSRDIT